MHSTICVANVRINCARLVEAVDWSFLLYLTQISADLRVNDSNHDWRLIELNLFPNGITITWSRRGQDRNMWIFSLKPCSTWESVAFLVVLHVRTYDLFILASTQLHQHLWKSKNQKNTRENPCHEITLLQRGREVKYSFHICGLWTDW